MTTKDNNETIEIIKGILDKISTLSKTGNIFQILQSNLYDREAVQVIGNLMEFYLGLKCVGTGATRITFLVEDKYALKLHFGADEYPSQNMIEFNALEEAKKQRINFAPEVYYYDENTILLKYVPHEVEDTSINKEIIKTYVNQLIQHGFIILNEDIQCLDNWRKDDAGNLYLIDWGQIQTSQKETKEVQSFINQIQGDSKCY